MTSTSKQKYRRDVKNSAKVINICFIQIMNKKKKDLFLIRVQKIYSKTKNSNKNPTYVSRASGEAELQKNI